MGIFEQFPYTNFHNLNLDWILKTVKDLYTRTVTWMEQNNIRFADPADWDISKTYDPNTIVYDSATKTAYISKQVVPAGTNISNSEYWLPITTLDAFPQYNPKTETLIFQGSITNR